MTKDKLSLIRRIYNILLSISIIVAGVCLMIGCLTIYYSGDQPYTPESVDATFSIYSIPIYLCLILMVVSFIWEFFFPYKNPVPKFGKPYASIQKRLAAKKDVCHGNETLISSINKERSLRKKHCIVRTILLLIACILFGVYALNSNNFHQSDINGSMIRAMLVLIPCFIVPFAYAIYTVYYNEKSFQREIELLKKLPSSTDSQNDSANSERKYNIMRYTFLILGIVLMVFGFVSGGFADVMTKAINICTECIGLG